MSLWTGLTYNTGWGDYGNGWAAGAFKLDGDRVSLRGVITSTGVSGTYPFLIATLPAGFVPPAKAALSAMIFSTDSMGGVANDECISIDTSGNLHFEGHAISNGNPLSLDGMSFSVLA